MTIEVKDLNGNILYSICKCGQHLYPLWQCMCDGSVNRGYGLSTKKKRPKYRKPGIGQLNLAGEDLRQSFWGPRL